MNNNINYYISTSSFAFTCPLGGTTVKHSLAFDLTLNEYKFCEILQILIVCVDW